MISDFDLTGKVALITGGNGGIGLGLAKGLAQAGAFISIWGTNPNKTASAVDELGAITATVHSAACDVGDEHQVERAFSETLERFGRVDAVFANAGVGQRGTRFAEQTVEEWRSIYRINMEGVFLTFRTAVRHMLERGGGGSLVATSSIASLYGMPRGEHYAATKAGVNALVRSLAVEYGKHGIRTNAVLPGWTATTMTDKYFESDAFQNAVLPRIPAGRWGDPADFSGIAVYLASDASRYHNGDVITVDGGYCSY